MLPGEGVNLQRAHLMVNYDLPWNPNRLEQRFGRIHRIGQLEVCHLWNLIAKDTREGDVYYRLLEKIEAEREALGGKVYDVLGRLFDQKALRDLLMEAIRYGNDPEVKARLDQAVDGAIDREQLQQILDERALVNDAMDTTQIQAIREEMERAHARRLQPHFIQAFFLDAFPRSRRQGPPPGGGPLGDHPCARAIRERDRHIGMGAPVLKRYERICFEKDKVDQQPRAELVCPGSPLSTPPSISSWNATGSSQARIGPGGQGRSRRHPAPALLPGARHPGRPPGPQRRTVDHLQTARSSSRSDPTGCSAMPAQPPIWTTGPSPLSEAPLLQAELDADWLQRDWESEVLSYAIAQVVPDHLKEVKAQRLAQIDRSNSRSKPG